MRYLTFTAVVIAAFVFGKRLGESIGLRQVIAVGMAPVERLTTSADLPENFRLWRWDD